MNMKIKAVLAGSLAVAALMAAALAVSGTAHASTRGPGSPAAVVENFTFTTTSVSDLPVFQATALGNSFFGTGTLAEVSHDPDGSNPVFRADMAGGTFMVATFDGQTSSSASPVTCQDTFTMTGSTYHIYQGTGELAGLTGNGTADVTATAVFPKSKHGVCNFGVSPLTSLEVVTATGPVTR